jgi:hypothetical protein
MANAENADVLFTVVLLAGICAIQSFGTVVGNYEEARVGSERKV